MHRTGISVVPDHADAAGEFALAVRDVLRQEPAMPGTRPVTPTVVYHRESLIDCHIFLTAADAIRERIARQPHGLVLDTTFLPAAAVLRAVVHHLGAPR